MLTIPKCSRPHDVVAAFIFFCETLTDCVFQPTHCPRPTSDASEQDRSPGLREHAVHQAQAAGDV